MPLPALAIPAGIKALPWRWIGAVAAGILLFFLIYLTVNSATSYMEGVAKRNYDRGVSETKAVYEKRRADDATAGFKRFVEQTAAGQDAVRGYLADIAANQPKREAVRQEIKKYEQSTDGLYGCMDAYGVRLIERSRAASGLRSEPGASAPDGAVSGRGRPTSAGDGR